MDSNYSRIVMIIHPFVSRLSFYILGEFMRNAQNFTQVTPLEIKILYQLTDLIHKNGYVASISSCVLDIDIYI